VNDLAVIGADEARALAHCALRHGRAGAEVGGAADLADGLKSSVLP